MKQNLKRRMLIQTTRGYDFIFNVKFLDGRDRIHHPFGRCCLSICFKSLSYSSIFVT